MALHPRASRDVKKSSYYVWYLGAKEAKGVDAMPGAIAYLLERERLQEPFKVTLQVSGKGLKIIQTVHPGGSAKSAVKHLVPGHAVLAAVQREDVVAATLLLPNPASNNPVHVHAYRCDSVETAELLGGQLRALAFQHHTENVGRAASAAEGRLRGNLGSDGRSTRESESSEGSAELRHENVQTNIYESLAAELRAKLGRGSSGENDVGPILLPPRDYDTVHRHRGNLAGIEFRRCLNQTIVGGGVGGGVGGTAIVDSRGGTRSGASSGIGSDSAATPPPYQPHHPLGPRPSRPSRDSSSDDDWGATTEETLEYLAQDETGAGLSLPRVPRSPDRLLTGPLNRGISPAGACRSRKPAEFRQRSPSPQYQPALGPAAEVTSPRERFQDAKEMFRAMEREAIARPVVARQRELENRPVHRVDSSRPIHPERSSRGYHHQPPPPPPSTTTTTSTTTSGVPTSGHERASRRNHSDAGDNDPSAYRARPRPRTHHYGIERTPEPEHARPRPRSFYENPAIGRDYRDQRNFIDPREVKEYRERAHARELREKVRARASAAYQELSEHERYPGLDRESARPPLEIVPTPGRYRHSYAEPPRLGLAALHPY